jgi:hypothetical protein
MVTRKPSARSRQMANPYLTTDSPDELEPPNRIAYEIMSERRDLLPSVERIMNAGLSGPATTDALTMFRTSLQAPGDPNRDPSVAIAHAAADHSEAPVPAES